MYRPFFLAIYSLVW